MSNNVTAYDTGITNDLFKKRGIHLFQHVMPILPIRKAARERKAHHASLIDETIMSLFKTVRPNIVQSIRAFRASDLAAEAQRLEQHFLYAVCSANQTKAEVLETISTSFFLPKPADKNYASLYENLTDFIDRSGPQPGFVIVLEGLPATQKFDKEARESLLDVFRDAAEFWAERKVNCRVFFSFRQ